MKGPQRHDEVAEKALTAAPVEGQTSQAGCSETYTLCGYRLNDVTLALQ